MSARLLGVLAVLAVATVTGQQAPPSFPPAAEIQQILQARLGDHPGLGFVVGLLDETGKRTIVAAGTGGEGKTRPLDGDTVFEIGSITKVFTSALLADMVQRGEVALDDPVAKYLPATVTVPSRGERQITLVDLATHTSALPRMPDNLSPRDPDNPYADYSPEQLYAFLSSYRLTRDIGVQYDYSNLGGGLLGVALARRAGTSYERAVTSRVLAPLRMQSTAITLSPALQARMALGHTALGFPTENWDLPAMAGAGALRSDVNDMLTFLAANMAQTSDRLTAALRSMQVSRYDVTTAQAGRPEMRIGLGWHTRKIAGGELIWHNGGTYGFHSIAGFDPRRRVAVVILHNSGAFIDDIGFHLLDPTIPLEAKAKAPPKPSRKEVAVSPKILASYAGRYELSPVRVATITVDGDIVCLQMTGQGKVRAYPESETSFFMKTVDAQFEFTKDASGTVTGLVVHQNGRDQTAKRM